MCYTTQMSPYIRGIYAGYAALGCTKLAVSANWIRHHAARGAMRRGRVEGPPALTTPWLKSTGNIDRLNEISTNTYDDAWSEWYKRMAGKHEAVTESIEDAQTVLRAKAKGQRAFAA